MERIKAAPRSIIKIYLQEGLNPVDILQKIKSKNLTYIFLSKHQFDKIARDFHSQGVIAEVQDYTYAALDNLLGLPLDSRPTLLFLDSITDPQNIGAILRTTACLGGFALVLPKYETCPITETVLRIASGAENYVPICRVANLSKALLLAKDSGYSLVATVVEDGESIFKTKLSFPLGLVIGSEAKGIRPGLIKYIDLKLTIPMPGVAVSFNVSAASAMVCYEVTRQKNKDLESTN